MQSFECPTASPMDRARSRTACIAIVVTTVVVFALLRAPFLSVPLERDEGEYAYLAQRMAEGEIPYRDTFDQKPPAVFLAYRLAFALFGESIEAIHGFAYLWTALTAMTLFALVARLAGSLAAAWTILVFAVAAMDPSIIATAANTEMFMLLPLVGSVLALVMGLRGDRPLAWLSCGLLAAWACWFKQVAGVNVFFIGGAILVASATGPAGRRVLPAVRRLAWLAAGGLLASLPVVWFFWGAGAWAPFLDAVFLHNLEYAQSVPLRFGLAMLGDRLADQFPSFAFLWLAAGSAWFVPLDLARRDRVLLIAFAVTSAAGVSIGLYFRPHYFVQLLPALSALAGVALGSATTAALRVSVTTGWIAVLGAGCLVLAPPIWAHRQILWAESETEISRRIYGINPFPESVAIAKHIRATSAPEDEIFVVGSEPQIPFYAGRRSASRYIFFYPLTGGYPDSRQRQREVVAQIAERRPLYVVWVNIATSLGIAEHSDLFIFHETSEWLQREYRVEFVARPEEKHAEFRFVYGGRASRVLKSVEGQMNKNPWVAVFRRYR